QGPRHLLQAERLHVHPPTLQAPRLCGRDRGRALDRQGFSRRAFLRPDLRLLAWRHAGERSMVRSRTARRNIRHAGARHRAARALLAQSLRSTAAPLRRGGYRAFDTQAARIDWRRFLDYMALHWEVLLVHLLNFRWAYPSERDHVPRWLMDELLGRLKRQLDLPPPRVKICRGRIFSPIDYEPAVREGGFGGIGEAGGVRHC